MRVLDINGDLQEADALGIAVDKARDSNAYPILLHFYGSRKECEFVDCVEGTYAMRLIMCI